MGAIWWNIRKVVGSEQATEVSECHVKEFFLLFVGTVIDDFEAVNL